MKFTGFGVLLVSGEETISIDSRNKTDKIQGGYTPIIRREVIAEWVFSRK